MPRGPGNQSRRHILSNSLAHIDPKQNGRHFAHGIYKAIS